MADVATFGVMVDPREAKEGARQVNQAFDSMGRKADQVQKDVDRNFEGLRQRFFGLRTAIFAVVTALGSMQLVQTISQFERLKGALVTVTGSADAATMAFDRIKNFAATTPFQLEEVTNAFIKLKAMGLDPSERALQSYGNTAASMGKSLDQFIEAVADAATGEFERLKEFGIRARTQGEQVTFTFRGVSTTVQKEASQIEEYLKRLGEVEFAGAMEEQMKRLPGVISNVGDSWAQLVEAIGEAGVTDVLIRGFRALIDILEELRFQVQNFGTTWDLIVSDATWAWEAFSGSISTTSSRIAGDFEYVRTAFSMLLTEIGALGDLIVWIGEKFMDLFTDMSSFEDLPANFAQMTIQLGLHWESLTEELTYLGNATVLALNEGWEHTGRFFEEIMQSIQLAFARVTDFIFNNLRAFLLRVGTGLKSIPGVGDLGQDILASAQALDEYTDSEEKLRIQIEKSEETWEERSRQLERERLQLTVLHEEKQSQIAEEILASSTLSTALIEEREARRAVIEVDEEAIVTTKELTEESIKRNEVLKEAQPIAEIWKTAANNIYGSFRDTIRDMLEDGEDAFKGFADRIWNVFKDMLADLATLAIAGPIIVPVMGMVGNTLGVPGTAMQGVFGQMGYSGAGGFPGLLGGLPGFFGGNSIGTAIGNTAYNLSPFSTITASNPLGLFGGLFGSAGAVPNWGYGLAGLGGGILGQQVFGGYGGLGGGIGGVLGTALGAGLGPFGMIAGGLLGSLGGGFLGGLFGGGDDNRRKKARVQLGMGMPHPNYIGPGIETAFGSLGFSQAHHLNVGQDEGGVLTFLRQLGAINDELASRLSTEEVERVTEALYGWMGGITASREALDLNSLGLEQYRKVLENVGGEFSEIMSEMSGSVEELHASAMELLTLRDSLSTLRDISPLLTLKTAKEAADALGGTTSLLALTTRYLEAYLSQEEQLERAITNATEVVDELMDATGISTRSMEEFREAFEEATPTGEDLASWLRAADALANLTSLQDRLTDIRNQEAEATERQAEATERLIRLEQQQRDAEVTAIEDRIVSALRNIISDIERQAGEVQAIADQWMRLGDRIRQTRDDLFVDPELSVLTPMQRYEETRRRFEDIERRARLGEQEALEELPEISREFLNISREMFASSQRYTEDFNLVTDSLREAEAVAERQKDIQIQIFNELVDQTELMRQTLEKITGRQEPRPPRPPRPGTTDTTVPGADTTGEINYEPWPQINRILSGVTGYTGSYGEGGFGEFYGRLSLSEQLNATNTILSLNQQLGQNRPAHFPQLFQSLRNLSTSDFASGRDFSENINNVNVALSGAFPQFTRDWGGGNFVNFIRQREQWEKLLAREIIRQIGGWEPTQFQSGGMLRAGAFGFAGEAGIELVSGPSRIYSKQETERILSNDKVVDELKLLRKSNTAVYRDMREELKGVREEITRLNRMISSSNAAA